jgi:hypothetical protein
VTVDVRDPSGIFIGDSRRLSGAGPHRIELERGTTFRLRVLDEGGRPVEASVTAWAAGARILELAPVGGDRWGAVPHGPAHLVVAAPGRATAILEVALGTNDRKAARSDRRKETDLGELRLAAGGSTIRGRIAAPTRALPTRALFRWGGAGQIATVAEDGTFELRGLPSAGEEATMLVFLRGDREVWARDLRPEGPVLDLGTIRIH